MKLIVTASSARCMLKLSNRGQITNLPVDCVVERLGNVSFVGALPGPVDSLCRLNFEVYGITVEAALKGDRNLAAQTMSLGSLERRSRFQRDRGDDGWLLLANRKWLLTFA